MMANVRLILTLSLFIIWDLTPAATTAKTGSDPKMPLFLLEQIKLWGADD